MAESYEWSLGETIIIQGSGPAPSYEWSEGETILDWEFSSGIRFDAVSLDGVNTI